jgi:hypothetical protein
MRDTQQCKNGVNCSLLIVFFSGIFRFYKISGFYAGNCNVGKNIFLAPEDVWIAETCQTHGCILVVCDGNVIKVF